MNSRRGKKQWWPSTAEQPSLGSGCKNPILKKVYLLHASEKVGHVAMVLWEVGDEESFGSLASDSLTLCAPARPGPRHDPRAAPMRVTGPTSRLQPLHAYHTPPGEIWPPTVSPVRTPGHPRCLFTWCGEVNALSVLADTTTTTTTLYPSLPIHPIPSLGPPSPFPHPNTHTVESSSSECERRKGPTLNVGTAQPRP